MLDDVVALDELIERHAARGVGNLDAVGRAILLLGLAELKYRDDVPTKVVINEGVELAKRYGASESFKFVNAVLDKTSRELERERRSRPSARHDRRVRDHRALLHAARARTRVLLGIGDDAAVLRWTA